MHFIIHIWICITCACASHKKLPMLKLFSLIQQFIKFYSEYNFILNINNLNIWDAPNAMTSNKYNQSKIIWKRESSVDSLFSNTTKFELGQVIGLVGSFIIQFVKTKPHSLYKILCTCKKNGPRPGNISCWYDD